jgi:hypothetical protein
MLEKAGQTMVESGIPLAGVAAPLMRSRALAAGFRPVSLSDLETLVEFYAYLDKPLADLNALMMVAWRRVLDLHLLIEDEVLYMVANWEAGPVLWGPPIGERVSINHIRRAFQLLRKLDPEDPKPVIAYLWESYSLWEELVGSDDFVAVREGTEYIYDTSRIAALAGSEYKKKRRDYDFFKKTQEPNVVEYSQEVAPGCLLLLDKWIQQKCKLVSAQDREKLLIECEACADALRERIPLTGIVALLAGHVQAFSIGGPHGRGSYNCMFEKTNLDFPQAPAFIFSELAKKCVSVYSEITIGEDWDVGYLAASKKLWKPIRQQASYYLQDKLGETLKTQKNTL